MTVSDKKKGRKRSIHISDSMHVIRSDFTSDDVILFYSHWLARIHFFFRKRRRTIGAARLRSSLLCVTGAVKRPTGVLVQLHMSREDSEVYIAYVCSDPDHARLCNVRIDHRGCYIGVSYIICTRPGQIINDVTDYDWHSVTL